MNREFYAFSSLFFRKNNRNTSYYLFFFLFLSSFLFSQASFPYYEDFEGSGNNGWTMVNGVTQPNKWYVGSATNNGGSRALYISNNGGATNGYTNSSNSITHSYRDISIPTGTTNAYITFDWKAYGEGPNYDYLQVWLVPATDTPTAGLLITPGAGRIQLGGNYFGQNSFQYSSNSVNLSSFAGKNMRVVFSWRNDYIYGYNDPAAIDNFSVTTYCKPKSSNPSSLYIREFQFVGVLNNPPAKTSTYSTGYEDWTSFTPIAQQPQNTAMNITAKTNGTTGGSWKAWVDWNRDGDFNDTGEEVYKMTTFTTPAVTFGFIIPSTVLGNYRLRIATSSTSKSDGTYDFSPCSVLSAGEFEDYLFNVVADCPAKVVRVNKVNTFDGERCGPGSVRLSAEGTASAVSFNWYDYDPNTNAYTYLATGTTYLTPSISSTKTYYVKAITNTDTSAANYCETPFYYPVVARIDPNPTVTFSKSKPAICGEDDPSLLVTAAGDRFQDVIFESFDSNLGQFNGNVTDAESIYTNAKAEWLNKPTPYIPLVAEGYEGLSPAMSSGYFGGNFAMINSDIDRNTNIKYQLISNNSTNPNKLLNVNGYLNLQLDFDLYHFSIAKNNTQGYIEVSYTLDASVSSPVWVSLALPGYTVADASVEYPNRYWVDMGNPLKWQHFSITIPGSNFTSDKFAIRFIHFSSGNIGAGQKFYEAITAVDNVRLSGFKTINTPFKWNSAATTIYDTNCVTPLSINDTRSTVCVKPSATELEDVNWALNASATFSNGCPAIGNFTVDNDTKTWRQPGITDWNQGAQWRPSTVPTINKCVIVRTPVELPTNTNGSHGLARSVIVKPGGSLIIQPKSSLTIQNHIKNETAASDVLVESDANLIQNNDASVNTGNITVKREALMKRLDYTYWGSPVTGQNLKAFSPATLDNRFYVYREIDDYFDGVYVYSKSGLYDGSVMPDAFPLQDKNTYNFEVTRGYAIRAPNTFPTSNTTFNGTFVGVPNNGIKNFVLKYDHDGNNFVTNPYSSNIDFDKLYADNSAYIYQTASFWTNVNPTPVMQGSNYPSRYLGVDYYNNYAIYNGSGGVGPTSTAPVNGASILIPNNFIKVGQGFMIKGKPEGKGQNLRFRNSIRTNDNSGRFYNSRIKNILPVDRYWLRLSTPLGVNNDVLIAYKEGATNQYEIDFDAKLMASPPDAFYSILDDNKLVIQGRAYPLNTQDKVTLGARFYEPGNYTISILQKEGIFADSQAIYIKDKLEGKVINLQEQNYSFNVSSEGNITDRFEVVYQPESTLATNQAAIRDAVIYYEQDNIVVAAADKIIDVLMYDSSGKLILKLSPNNTKAKINTANLSKGIYLLHIKMLGKTITKKVIK